MLKNLKKQTRKIEFALFSLAIMISPSIVLAAWKLQNAPAGLPNKALDEVVIDITDWILGFAGILALLFIIWGGIQYTTAAGNENQMDTAKKTLQWGITGLVIVGLSFAIIKVIIDVWLKTT